MIPSHRHGVRIEAFNADFSTVRHLPFGLRFCTSTALEAEPVLYPYAPLSLDHLRSLA